MNQETRLQLLRDAISIALTNAVWINARDPAKYVIEIAKELEKYVNGTE